MIVLFHVVYLFGQYLYRNHRNKRYYAEEKTLIDEDDFSDSSNVIDKSPNRKFQPIESLRFSPPAFLQRYEAVCNALTNPIYEGKIRKVVDFGCAEMGLLVFLKSIKEVEEILCVDVDREVLERHKPKAQPLLVEHLSPRETPLTIEIYEGSVIHNDRKLEQTDAVICIELIEHLHEDTLMDLPFNIFGYIKPKVVIITTPNADFNILFPNFSGTRHRDHKFEWTREQFQDWAQNIVTRYPSYSVAFYGICEGPVGTEVLGACTQMAVFHRLSPIEECSEIIGVDELFKLVDKHVYPIFVDNRSDNEKLLQEAIHYIFSLYYNREDQDEKIILKDVLSYLHEKNFTATIETLKEVLRNANWVIKDQEDGPVIMVNCDFDSEDENETFDMDNDSIYEENKIPESIDKDEQTSCENLYTANWDEQISIVIPENRSIIQENSYLFDGENLDLEYESSNKLHKNDDDIRVLKINNTESLICTEQELSSVPTSLPLNETEVDSKVERLNSDTPLDFNTSLAKSNSSLAFNYSSVDNTVTESTLLQIRDINLAAVEEQVQKTTNFQPYMSVSLSSTAPPLIFSSELNDSLDNCSASFQNESCDKFHHISLNDTFRESEITNESAMNVEEFTTENILSLPLKQNFPEEDCIQNSEINSAISFSNCAKIKNKYSSEQVIPIKNQVYENNDTADMAPLNDFNSSPNKQPKFTSSPKVSTKTSTNNIERSDSKLKESSAVNRNILSCIIESTKENVSDTDSSSSKDISQKSNNTTNIEILQLCADSSSDNIINISKCNVDSHLVSNNTQQHLCLGNEELNKMVESTCDPEVEKSDVINCESDITDDVQNVDAHHSLSSKNEEFSKIVESTRNPEKFVEQSNVINREFDIIDVVQNVDAHHSLLSNNENINDKEEDMCCTLTKTDDNDITMKAHQEDVMNDFAQLNVTKKSLISPKELSSFKLQNDSECSSTECAKKTSILETDRLISNNSSSSSSNNKDTTNIQFTSILKKGDEIVGTSKDVNTSNIVGSVNVEAKLASPFETPPNSWSPEIMDSGYPNSASVQDITPEYDLSSIAQDHIPDSESPSIAEAPRLGILEPIEVENGDLANNNRDDEGNNMMAVDADDIENLQPLIDVLENDLENENDIYVVQNGFPIWLLRLLDMANPLDFDMQDQHLRGLEDEVADDANYVGRDEGFDSSSSENESDI